MENLVTVEGKQALTTSLKIAEVFEKRHDHVLRDIEKVIEDLKSKPRSNATLPKFGESSYINSKNMVLKMYTLNFEAFMLLIMGYNGDKALDVKLSYMQAFREMEAYIRHMQGKTLSEEEAAMIHQLLNFYRFLDNCKKAEEQHRKQFIASNSHDKTKEELVGLAQDFYKMRNFLLEIGNAKELEGRYKRYCLENPKAIYYPKASKFVMLFTIDKYEAVRGAIFDFLKMEWYSDEYSVHFSKQAKNVAQKTNLELVHKNETNLFQEEEIDVIDMSKLRYLASQLLTLEN